MSKTLRRVQNTAVHYKKGVLKNPALYRKQIRNRPYSNFTPGELQPVVEASFHSDHYPTFAKKSQLRRQTNRKLRHLNKSYVHECVSDETYSGYHLPPVKKEALL